MNCARYFCPPMNSPACWHRIFCWRSRGDWKKPWRSLRVYYHLARSADDALQAARDAAAVLPEALFDEFEEMARALERDGARELDARTTLMRVSYFADYADGLAGQAAKIGDNVFLNRVEACRDVAGEAFERFGELALAQIRAADAGASGGWIDTVDDPTARLCFAAWR